MGHGTRTLQCLEAAKLLELQLLACGVFRSKFAAKASVFVVQCLFVVTSGAEGPRVEVSASHRQEGQEG